jgi:DNA-directed RNA polymerase specialized sigma24 family protein
VPGCWPAPACCGAATSWATCCVRCATPLSASAEPRAAAPATTSLIEDRAGGSRSSDDPAEAAHSRELYAAIHELPDEFRDALVAVDVVGLSYKEAARALDVAHGTLTSRLFRARDRLARRLEESPGQ